MNAHRFLRRFRKWSCLLLSYLLLNAGVLGWIQVSASSGNKLRQSQTAMAEVSPEASPGDQRNAAVQIAVLGTPVRIPTGLLHTAPAQITLLSCLDPLSIGCLALLGELS